jgi:hypothetical protein
MSTWAKARLGAACVVVAALLMAVWLSPGSASVPRGTSQSDCTALETIGDSRGSLSTDPSDVKTLAAAYSDAAKQVSDKKLKNALSTISAIYKSVAAAKTNAGKASVVAKNLKKYASAFGVYSKALVSCAAASVTIPDNITIPSNVTLPNITLPSGVTLPTLPR